MKIKRIGFLCPEKDVCVFGVFEGADYAWNEISEPFELYKSYKNEISKKTIIEHLKTVAKNPICCRAGINYDIISGEEIPDICFCRDDDFVFPTDFIYYMEKYGIGIPPEYEEYLKKILI